MPNYIYNIVRMKGITELPLFTSIGDSIHFDFNKLVPTPEALKVESSTKTTESVLYYCTKQCSRPISALSKKELALLRMLINPELLEQLFQKVSTRMKTTPISEQEQLYQDGGMYFSNYMTYGVPTWYEWCRRRWGTKWSGLDAKFLSRDTVSFYTAWSPPAPLLRRLSRMHPTTEIFHFWEGPYPGSIIGRCWINAGKERIEQLRWPEAAYM